ncbi:adenylate kinase domain protein [Cooperia oncophora]
MLRVLLSGPAGSGKNTIAKMLLKEFDQFGYFSAGDVIRDHIQRGTEFGQRVASFVRKGELIPDSIVNGILLEEIRHSGNKLILNGTYRQLDLLFFCSESPNLLVVGQPMG